MARARVGNYQAPVDPQGVDDDMKKVLFPADHDNPLPKTPSMGKELKPELHDNPIPKAPGRSIGRIVKDLGAGLLGKREHTPQEEKDFKFKGQLAYLNSGKAKTTSVIAQDIINGRTSKTGSAMSPTTRKDR